MEECIGLGSQDSQESFRSLSFAIGDFNQLYKFYNFFKENINLFSTCSFPIFSFFIR